MPSTSRWPSPCTDRDGDGNRDNPARLAHLQAHCVDRDVWSFALYHARGTLSRGRRTTQKVRCLGFSRCPPPTSHGARRPIVLDRLDVRLSCTTAVSAFSPSQRGSRSGEEKLPVLVAGCATPPYRPGSPNRPYSRCMMRACRQSGKLAFVSDVLPQSSEIPVFAIIRIELTAKPVPVSVCGVARR